MNFETKKSPLCNKTCKPFHTAHPHEIGKKHTLYVRVVSSLYHRTTPPAPFSLKASRMAQLYRISILRYIHLSLDSPNLLRFHFTEMRGPIQNPPLHVGVEGLGVTKSQQHGCLRWRRVYLYIAPMSLKYILLGERGRCLG